MEKDSINLKNRPLVTGEISSKSALLFYFLLFGLSLLLVKLNINESHIWPYILYLLILINYNFVVDEFPYLKNIVVSTAILMPIVSLDQILLGQVSRFELLIAAFCFNFSRELLMDVIDARGDGQTLFKFLGKELSEKTAFTIQAATLFLLAMFQISPKNVLGLILLLITVICWIDWKNGNQKRAIKISRLQIVLAIGFLI